MAYVTRGMTQFFTAYGGADVYTSEGYNYIYIGYDWVYQDGGNRKRYTLYVNNDGGATGTTHHTGINDGGYKSPPDRWEIFSNAYVNSEYYNDFWNPLDWESGDPWPASGYDAFLLAVGDYALENFGNRYQRLIYSNIPIFDTINNQAGINKYKNTGDWSDADNARDLAPRLYANWTVGYTMSDDTVYSLACDVPLFADDTSEFYGLGATSVIELEAIMHVGEQAIAGYRTTYAYGQTWQDNISGIVGNADDNIADALALKIMSVLDIDDTLLKFKVVTTKPDGTTVETARGYVNFNHSSVIDYGFYTSPQGDTINFRQGEVLSDDDSNTSNADVELDEGDTVPDGNVPDVTGAGLLTQSYAVTPQQAQGVGQFLWGASFMTNIKLLNNSPIENVVGCKLFPIEFSGTSAEIVIGNVASGTTSDKLGSSVFRRVSDSVSISHKFSGNLKFLDYAPYSKCEIYLPFVGMRELPLDEVMNHKIRVIWLIDVITGTLQTDVQTTHDGAGTKYVTIQSHISTIGVDIPLTAQNRSQVESAYISNAIHGGLAIASGNVAGALGSAVNIATTQHHSQSTGSPSPSTSISATLTPYILRTVPIPKQIGDETNDTYRELAGAPCNRAETLGNLQGYTEVENPSIAVAGATLRELNEINSLLRSGVYLPYKS